MSSPRNVARVSSASTDSPGLPFLRKPDNWEESIPVLRSMSMSDNRRSSFNFLNVVCTRCRAVEAIQPTSVTASL